LLELVAIKAVQGSRVKIHAQTQHHEHQEANANHLETPLLIRFVNHNRKNRVGRPDEIGTSGRVFIQQEVPIVLANMASQALESSEFLAGFGDLLERLGAILPTVVFDRILLVY